MPHLSSLFNVTKCRNLKNIMRIATWFSLNLIKNTKWNVLDFSNNVKNCLEQINVTFNIYCFWLFEKIGRLWSLLLLICFGIFYYYFSVLWMVFGSKCIFLFSMEKIGSIHSNTLHFTSLFCLFLFEMVFDVDITTLSIYLSN